MTILKNLFIKETPLESFLPQHFLKIWRKGNYSKAYWNVIIKRNYRSLEILAYQNRPTIYEQWNWHSSLLLARPAD